MSSQFVARVTDKAGVSHTYVSDTNLLISIWTYSYSDQKLLEEALKPDTIIKDGITKGHVNIINAWDNARFSIKLLEPTMSRGAQLCQITDLTTDKSCEVTCNVEIVINTGYVDEDGFLIYKEGKLYFEGSVVVEITKESRKPQFNFIFSFQMGVPPKEDDDNDDGGTYLRSRL